MPARLHLFHTGDQHIPVFTALFAELAPEIELDHTVRADLLSRSLAAGRLTEDVAGETAQALKELASDGVATLCTCSTIGPAVDSVQGKSAAPIMRIDRAMAEHAVERHNHITIAAAAASTLGPTRALVESVARQAGKTIDIDMVHIEDAWPHFERGDRGAYEEAIATHLRTLNPTPRIILLAQASMAGAADRLADLDCEILSSPRLGAKAAIEKCRRLSSNTNTPH